MLKLIKNEYIKLFKKKTTYIWLIGVALCSLGIQFLVHLESSIDYNYSYEDTETAFSDSEYDQEIKYYNVAKTEGYEAYIDYYNKLKELKIYDYDWKMEALSVAYKEIYAISTDENSVKIADNLVKSVEEEDYKSFVDTMAKKEKLQPTEYTYDGSEDAISVYSYMSENNRYYEYSSDEFSLITTITGLQDTLQETSLSGTSSKEYADAKEKLMIYKYKLDNEIFNENLESGVTLDTISSMDDSFWKYMKLSECCIIIVSVLMVIIAGGIVASEYSSGTIKFYLLNPKSRTKLILSKLLTVFSLTILTIAGYILINAIYSMIFGGTDITGVYHVFVDNGVVKCYSATTLILIEYLFKAISVLVMATMAFAISTLFKKSAVSTGIGVACLLGGSTVSLMLRGFNIDWGRYLIFSNIDLYNIREGLSYYSMHSFSGAVINVTIHMIVFLLIAHDSFTRREV